MKPLSITLVEAATIKPREGSQRQKVSGLEELAESIRRVGLIHPIILAEDLTLIAGGRRLAAMTQILGQTMVPVIFRNELDSTLRKLLELDENIRRSDLTWQEEASAVGEMRKIMKEQGMNTDKSAQYIGISRRTLLNYVALAAAIKNKHPRVLAAPTANAALNILEREKARKHDNALNELYEELGTQVEPQLEADCQSPVTHPQSPNLTFKPAAKPRAPKVVFQADFLQWLDSYSGPAFNLIHCDFPYGINHQSSKMGGNEGAWDVYEDSPETYWTLIRALCVHRNKIMLPSCHLIFWFSMKWYEETLKAFATLAPDLDFNHMPLVWHKTDNKGIIRDVTRTPRHVYETAFLASRGDRKIITPVADVYAAPTGKSEALHVSQKPIPVLKHFFRLCVDEYTEMLDPTCGSGSALQAATQSGARRVLGLELNPDYADAAQRDYERSLALELLHKEIDDAATS